MVVVAKKSFFCGCGLVVFSINNWPVGEAARFCCSQSQQLWLRLELKRNKERKGCLKSCSFCCVFFQVLCSLFFVLLDLKLQNQHPIFELKSYLLSVISRSLGINLCIHCWHKIDGTYIHMNVQVLNVPRTGNWTGSKKSEALFYFLLNLGSFIMGVNYFLLRMMRL